MLSKQAFAVRSSTCVLVHLILGNVWGGTLGKPSGEQYSKERFRGNTGENSWGAALGKYLWGATLGRTF